MLNGRYTRSSCFHPCTRSTKPSTPTQRSTHMPVLIPEADSDIPAPRKHRHTVSCMKIEYFIPDVDEGRWDGHTGAQCNGEEADIREVTRDKIRVQYSV